MKRCLADANVLLPLLVVNHKHHQVAVRWFDGLRDGEVVVVCRMVHLALMRLLCNRAVMREYVISASAAWRLIEAVFEHERLEFADEPAVLQDVMPTLLKYPAPTGKLVSDAYLAAFAIAGRMRMVTFDRGFAQYHGLDLELIGDSPSPVKLGSDA